MENEPNLKMYSLLKMGISIDMFDYRSVSI